VVGDGGFDLGFSLDHSEPPALGLAPDPSHQPTEKETGRGRGDATEGLGYGTNGHGRDGRFGTDRERKWGQGKR